MSCLRLVVSREDRLPAAFILDGSVMAVVGVQRPTGWVGGECTIRPWWGIGALRGLCMSARGSRRRWRSASS